MAAYASPRFTERSGSAAADERLASRGESGGDSLACADAGFRVPAVEGTYPDREREVEPWLAGKEFEVLGGDMAHAQQTGRDLGGSVALDLSHSLGRPVDHQDVSVPDASRHGFGGGSGRSADLQNPASRDAVPARRPLPRAGRTAEARSSLLAAGVAAGESHVLAGPR